MDITGHRSSIPLAAWRATHDYMQSYNWGSSGNEKICTNHSVGAGKILKNLSVQVNNITQLGSHFCVQHDLDEMVNVRDMGEILNRLSEPYIKTKNEHGEKK